MTLPHCWRSVRAAARDRDVVVTLALCLLLAGALVTDAARSGHSLVLALIPGAVAAVILRHRLAPVALVLASAVAAARPENRALMLTIMVVLYTIALRSPWRAAAGMGAGAAGIVIIAGAAWGGGAATGHGGLLGYAIGTSASCASAVAVGLYIAAQRRVRDGLRERAERLDRERELLAERAVAEERIRIAQELHDIVAHNVSLIVVQAQALGATITDERAGRTADTIAQLGRHAMSEMHTTLRLLRAPGTLPDFSPQPGLDQLERLIEQARAAGLRVEFTIEGHPRPLTQALDLSAFRIVQEALTNVIKHAVRSSVHVTIAYRELGVNITISDRNAEGEVPVPETTPTDGHGVIGMRERAALFGGTLRAERLPTGFQVTASLPYDSIL